MSQQQKPPEKPVTIMDVATEDVEVTYKHFNKNYPPAVAAQLTAAAATMVLGHFINNMGMKASLEAQAAKIHTIKGAN